LQRAYRDALDVNLPERSRVWIAFRIGRSMANGTTIQPSKQPSWQNVMIAFGLSAGLIVVASLIGSVIPYPAFMVLLAAAAFVGAGFLTVRIRPAARPVEPAIGAALMVLVLIIAQQALAPESISGLSSMQTVVSALIFIAFAASLAWLGARVGTRGTMVGPRRRASSSV
jgi:hypothetical protein